MPGLEFELASLPVTNSRLEADQCGLRAKWIQVKESKTGGYPAHGDVTVKIGSLACDKCDLGAFKGMSNIGFNVGTQLSLRMALEAVEGICSGYNFPCQNPDNSPATEPGEQS